MLTPEFNELANLFMKEQDNFKELDLDFSNPMIANLKIAVDWNKLYKSSNSLLYSEINRIYNMLLKNERDILSIVLVGSVARGVAHEKSDIDILVILDKQRKKFSNLTYNSSFKEVNIVCRTKKAFLDSYKAGEEFFIWCVKYGLLLYDKNFYVKLYLEPLARLKFDEVINKRSYVNFLIIKIYDSLTANDLQQGIKLIKKMVIQTARMIILSHEIIPKSRPELLTQLQEINSTFVQLYSIMGSLEKMDFKELTNYTYSVFDYMNNYFLQHYSSMNYNKRRTEDEEKKKNN